MLVLSRLRDETIMIGDDIELTIVDIRGDKVRIGIRAPAHVAVHRKEIYDAIKRENEQAACLRGNDLKSLAGQQPMQRRSRRILPTAAKLNDQSAPRRESA
jgi:carbon storage regulator